MEFKASRRDRVAAFCAASGYVMPRNFDIAQPVYRLVVVDLSTQPPQLLPRSTYLEADVLAHCRAPESVGNEFRIFDFKRGVELHDPRTGKRLLKGQAFDWRLGAPAAA
jgi:hypothetical protein